MQTLRMFAQAASAAMILLLNAGLVHAEPKAPSAAAEKTCNEALEDCKKVKRLNAECGEFRNCKTECRKGKRTCKKETREVKHDCKAEAKAEREGCINACGGGKEGRNCKKDCREKFRDDKKDCRATVREEREVCKDDKKSCVSDCRAQFRTPECVAARKANLKNIARCGVAAAKCGYDALKKQAAADASSQAEQVKQEDTDDDSAE